MIENTVEVKELPGVYQTILDLLPSNPFASLTNGDMMPIIVFSLFLGFAIISIGDAAKPLADVISVCSQAMFKIVNMILGIIPFGVFGLMSVSLAKYGLCNFRTGSEIYLNRLSGKYYHVCGGLFHIPYFHSQGKSDKILEEGI